MISASKTRSSRLRENLNHPVIDCDAHFVETLPVFERFLEDYVKPIGGGDLLKRFGEVGGYNYYDRCLQPWLRMSDEERRRIWMPRPPWWVLPSKTIDAATARIPRLMYERLDDAGIDFSVLYPSLALLTGGIIDDEIRPVACRAFNTYFKEVYDEFSYRMTPAAVIPTGNPDEAIAELEYAVETLGLKAIMIDGIQHRFPPDATDREKKLPRYGAGLNTRIDNLCIDSEFDYDPFWQRCLELKVSPSSHTPGQNMGTRTSVSNWVYNHIGNFGASMEASCKGLFMGGVTHRFPELHFGFLECGISWACNLLTDLVGHWKKRGGDHIFQYDPAKTDLKLMKQLIKDYGGERFNAMNENDLDRVFKSHDPGHTQLDDYAACGIRTKQDIYDKFIPRFYFGCEADDPFVHLAYKTEIYDGHELRPVFSSDIGHWDVTDVDGVLEEAYELLEDNLVTEDQFRKFMFDNPIHMYANLNRDFFKGTCVEQEAAEFLSREYPDEVTSAGVAA